MKKKLLPMLVSLLALSSCTIFAVDVHSAPDDMPPDPPHSETSSTSETSHETSSENSSSEITTTTETSTGPIIKGLTYEEAQPIIKQIKDYVSSNDVLETRYTSKISTKTVNGGKASGEELLPDIGINDEVSETYVDFTNYCFYNTLLNKETKLGKETIKADKESHIYQKEKDSLEFINAVNDKVKKEKTYQVSKANSIEELDGKFTGLTKMGKTDNKNLTIIALDLISSSQITANSIVEYDITSSDDKSIACEILYHLNLTSLIKILGKIGAIDLSMFPDIEGIGEFKLKVNVAINNYRLFNFRLAIAPKAINYAIYSISYLINYEDKEFIKPDLSGYTLKETTPKDPNNDSNTTEVVKG